MKTIAEKLTPPFIEAIILDTTQRDRKGGPSPSDKMVSLAPSQDGFLGLETDCDEQGRWLSISYWRDQHSVTAWRETGTAKVAKDPSGRRLGKTCRFQISIINEPTFREKLLASKAPAVVKNSHQPDTPKWKTMITFPAIAELLGYEYVR
jgi:heme-degrading monooxygenase HmoA